MLTSKNDKTEDYLEFYKTVLKLEGDDYIKFKDVISQPLPYTIRINNTSFKKDIAKMIESKFLEICKKLEYADDMYVFYKRNQLRTLGIKIDEKLYKEFTDFLIENTEVGHIQRQEVVSTIPVECMGIKKGDFVYEPCAAPGSKTKQILEKLDGTGLAIANDKGKKRTNILVTEAQKQNPSPLAVTNYCGVGFPGPTDDFYLFDKISCDVPCSGDGTIRKNVDVVANWSVSTSICNLRIQRKILKRSLELLAPGGICAYSTCSLNPIEDEYVLDQVLSEFSDCELIHPDRIDKHYTYGDDKDKLKIRSGITDFEYVYKRSKGDVTYKFNNPNLNKCIRIMPQDNDTGGFFVALIKKSGEKTAVKPKNEDGLENNKTLFDFKDKGEIDASWIQKNDISHLICHSDSFNNINAVNNDLYDYLSINNRIKVMRAGIKAYEKCSYIRESNGFKHLYAPKSVYLNKMSYNTQFNIDMSDFKILVKTASVLKSALKSPDLISAEGYFTISVDEIGAKFMGNASKDKVVLLINKHYRKVLDGLYG